MRTYYIYPTPSRPTEQLPPYNAEQYKAAFFKLYDDANTVLEIVGGIAECGWCPFLRDCYSRGTDRPRSDCRERIFKWYLENSNSVSSTSKV